MFGIKERIQAATIGLTLIMGVSSIDDAQSQSLSSAPPTPATSLSVAQLNELTQRSSAPIQLSDGRMMRLEIGRVLLTDTSKKIAARSFTLPAIRIGATSIALPNKRVLIWGGVDSLGSLLETGEWFDPSTGEFSTANTVLAPEVGQSMTLLSSGTVLVSGGLSIDNVVRAHPYLWNPSTEQVTPINTTEPLRSGQTTVLLRDGTVSLYGGVDQNGLPIYGTQNFDPSHNTFKESGAPVPDTGTLSVVASSPVANSENNAASTPISVRFSMAVDPRTISPATVSLIGPAGPVAANVAGLQNGRLAFLSPSSDLLTGSRYTLVLAGVKSASGQSLPFTSIGFQTASLTANASNNSGQSDTKQSNAAPSTNSATTTTAIPTVASNVAAPSGFTLYQSTGVDAQGKMQASPPCNSKTHVLQLCRETSFTNDGAWYPGRNNAGTPGNGRWRLNVPDMSAAEIATAAVARHAAVKQARSLSMSAKKSSSVSGQVDLIDGQPVEHVQVTINKVSGYTDAQGRFTLNGVASGRQLVFVDGTTANHEGFEYGQFVVGVDVLASGVTQMPYHMYLPRILDRDKIEISSPTKQDMVVTHPDIPGLEIHIPAGTVIRDYKGKIVTQLAIVPIPVDRSPSPTPVNFPVYFSMQPGGATVQSIDPKKPQGLTLTYPNYGHTPSGTTASFIAYEPEDGWRLYGKGAITPDGTQLKPEAGVHLDVLTPASWLEGSAHPGDPKAAKPNGPCCGDPVDLNTGTLVENQTDVTINDVMPISLTRSWHAVGSSALVNASYISDSRMFGGWRSNYDTYIYSPSGSWTDPGQGVRLPGGYLVAPFAPIAPQNGMQQTWQYSGTETQFVGAILNAPFGVDQCNNPNGSECYYLQTRDGTQYWYDDYNGIYLIRDKFGNEINIAKNGGFVEQVTSPSGRYLSFSYDENNNVASVADNAGRNWTYSYHADTVPVGLWAVDSSTPPSTGYATTTLYMLDKVTYPDLTSSNFTYDENFSLPTAASGTSGQVSPTTCPYYRVPGTLLSMVDRNGETVMKNSYCSLEVTKQTLADGSTYQFAYQQDSNDNTLSTNVTDPLGNVRQLTFDPSSGYPSTDTRGYGSALAQTTTFVRNAFGQITSQTDALGRTTSYSYDANGNVSQTTSMVGTSSAATDSFTWTSDYSQLKTHTDALGDITTYSYTNGCLTGIVDALGHATSILCNSAGQPVQVTDALGHTSSLTYQSNDLRSIADALGNTLTFAVDPLGQLTAVTDAMGHQTLRQYDSNGWLTKSTDPRGQITQLGYDNEGHVTSVTLPSAAVIATTYMSRYWVNKRTDALGQSEQWTYDGLGNLLTSVDRKGQTTAYSPRDALGRFTQVTYADGSTITANNYDLANRLLKFTDSASGVITRSYDGLDHLTGESTPQGALTYTYAANGLRTSMTAANQAPVSYSYDAANRLTGISQGSEAVVLGYDNANRRTTLTLPDGVVENYGYDVANELTGISYTTASNSTIGSLSYTYDAAGRRVGRSNSLVSDQLPQPTNNGTFDLNNRQTVFNGNAFSYDANGNLTGDGTNTYIWNARNQLTQIQQNAMTVASFSYDASGRRSAKTIGGVTTNFLYDGVNAVQETQGSIVNPILTGLHADERFARNEGTARSYFLTDALGSTIALSDSNGAVMQQYQYDPYGNTTSGVSTTNSYQYTGRENDGNGLYYYRARYYSAAMGRFISEDPAGFNGGQDNFYAYARDNPLSYTDPTGKDPLIGATVGLIAGAIQGGLGAELQGGSWKDILVSAAVGGAIGAGVGALDPSFGVATLAIVGGISGGLGDLVGQSIASYGDPCKSINLGSTAGAVVGGAISGAGGLVLGQLGEAAGLSEGVSTAMGASLSSGPSIFLPAVGGALVGSGISQ